MQIWLLIKSKHILPSGLLKALPSIYTSSSLNNTHVMCTLYTHIHADACTHTKTHLGFWHIFLPFFTICNGIPHEFRILNSCTSVINGEKHNKTKTKKKQWHFRFLKFTSFKAYKIHVTKMVPDLIIIQRDSLPFGPIFARIEWICTINSSFGGDSLLAFISNCNNICEPPLATKKLALRPPPKKNFLKFV